MVHDENMTWLWWCYAVYLQYKYYILAITNLCPLQGTGGHGLDPGPKSLKMELAAPRLAVRFTG